MAEAQCQVQEFQNPSHPNQKCVPTFVTLNRQPQHAQLVDATLKFT